MHNNLHCDKCYTIYPHLPRKSQSSIPHTQTDQLLQLSNVVKGYLQNFAAWNLLTKILNKYFFVQGMLSCYDNSHKVLWQLSSGVSR